MAEDTSEVNEKVLFCPADCVPAFTTMHRGVLFNLPVTPDTNAAMQIFRVIAEPEE